jgi:hypothetical protein
VPNNLYSSNCVLPIGICNQANMTTQMLRYPNEHCYMWAHFLNSDFVGTVQHTPVLHSTVQKIKLQASQLSCKILLGCNYVRKFYACTLILLPYLVPFFQDFRQKCLKHFTSLLHKHVQTWRMPSSGMLRGVALVRTDVWGEHITIIRVTRIGELGKNAACVGC